MPAYDYHGGEKSRLLRPVRSAGFPLKKYLGEIERQINARANAHRECVVFSRSFQQAKILPDNLARVSYASLLESRSLNALLSAMKLAFM